jgi:hypothetical protein
MFAIITVQHKATSEPSSVITSLGHKNLHAAVTSLQSFTIVDILVIRCRWLLLLFLLSILASTEEQFVYNDLDNVFVNWNNSSSSHDCGTFFKEYIKCWLGKERSHDLLGCKCRCRAQQHVFLELDWVLLPQMKSHVVRSKDTVEVLIVSCELVLLTPSFFIPNNGGICVFPLPSLAGKQQTTNSTTPVLAFLPVTRRPNSNTNFSLYG